MGLGVLVTLFVAWQIASTAIAATRLRSEAKRLLVTNAPTVLWPNMTVPFTRDGHVWLPDGQLARVAGMRKPARGKTISSHPGAPVTRGLQELRAQQVGYTVVQTDPAGCPIVQIWALGPRAYAGMCGNSSREERRRGAMLVWRNVGAYLAERGEGPFDLALSPGPISATGY